MELPLPSFEPRYSLKEMKVNADIRRLKTMV